MKPRGRSATKIGFPNAFRVSVAAPPRSLWNSKRMAFVPRIQDAWRSIPDQIAAFNAGNSKVKFGFHNITGDHGEKEALAVDLLDDDAPLSPSTKYLLMVAKAAREQGLQTGILWDLPKRLQDGVEAAIAAGNFDARVKGGWDPTHIEPTGITIAEAKSGKRPA